MDLNALKSAVLEDGIVDPEEAAQINAAIHDADGDMGADVSRAEADVLFDINTAVAGKENAIEWDDVFVNGITEHVLADETSPGEIDADEEAYLKMKIGEDGVVDSRELKLLVNITSQATKCTDGFNTYVLDCLKAVILEDGIVDEDEVEMIKAVIYGTGGGDGEGISREEADFLFDVNDEVSGKENAPGWKELFVESISKHVLEDVTSPGEIDESEADWLIERVKGDGVYDEAEIALFGKIKTTASVVHEKLEFQFNLMSV